MRRAGISRRRFLQTSAWVTAAAARPGALQAALPPPSYPRQYNLHYLQPAAAWPDALPVGNGRLGAMVFGRPANERIQLNEETVWMGGPRDRNNPQAARTSEVRALLMAGKVHEAEALAKQVMMGIPDRLPCYQTLGDLWLDFDGIPAEVQSYHLSLDLDQAIASTSFKVGDVSYSREVFSSAPDNVIVVRITSNKPMSFKVRLDRPAYAETKASDHTLVMTGQALPVKPTTDPATQEHQVGVRFRAELHATALSGTIVPDGDTLRIHSTSVTLYLAAHTDFRERDEAGMTAACAKSLTGAKRLSYETLRARHIADYRSYATRADIHLGPDPNANIPTDKRLQSLKAGGEDLGLIPLYFQYGRYMLISSSRPGTLAANLQGIWNESVDPPWGSKYTVNINAEMNYWLAEPANLADLHTPLFDLIDSTRLNGAVTAQKYYNARGFVINHNTDIWGDTIPIDNVQAGVWPMGAAWLTLHLFSHYAFSLDKTFLRDRAYPRLKEVAEFFLDYLTEAPDGSLLSGPSQSPENKYRLPGGGTYSLCMSPTMDTGIIHAVFDRVIRMSTMLNVDPELRAKCQAASNRLQPFKIGKSGALQEWNEDYAETEPGHRHISHLFALYPDHQITLRETPDLAKAAHKTLDLRLAAGGGSTGWSRAWTINCFARLEDGDAAYQSVLALLRTETRGNMFDICGMKANSPFQIDGNLGGAAGICEMLLQSHNGVTRLLPALPKAWATGSFSGLRARSGITVSCEWKDSRLIRAQIVTTVDGPIKIAVPAGQTVDRITGGGSRIALTPVPGIGVQFNAKPHAGYIVTFA